MASRPAPARRRILVAEILAIGTEITVGETRDTNSGELARALTEAGVRITRFVAVPDELEAVRGAFGAALERADLVISTGGLGPTPDDLTREAVAELCRERPAVDPALESWLRDLWSRRGIPFPELNLKQAWLIPSATALPNPNGTAPGWWVDRPDGRVIVVMPGPPREMRPMWADQALPRLRERGIGRVGCVRTYRLTGIGESAVADLLGEELLRAANPVVATYARADAVDVRISAVAEDAADADRGEARPGERGRSAEELVDEAEAIVLGALGSHVWGRDTDTWPGAIGARLEHLGWTLATAETGTGGTLIALLGAAPWLRLAESHAADEPPTDIPGALAAAAGELRERSGAAVGMALRIDANGHDTRVSLAIATPSGTRTEEHLAFLSGPQGRSRAPLIAAASLLARLREEAREEDLAGR